MLYPFELRARAVRRSIQIIRGRSNSKPGQNLPGTRFSNLLHSPGLGEDLGITTEDTKVFVASKNQSPRAFSFRGQASPPEALAVHAEV
jgi:hypothetical protein